MVDLITGVAAETDRRASGRFSAEKDGDVSHLLDQSASGALGNLGREGFSFLFEVRKTDFHEFMQ
jgi:hypothetical protein